jgi:hypothetical protein
MEENKIPIKASLEFGEGIGYFINEHKKRNDITTNCDDFNFFSEPENNPFDYFIKYIYYSLKDNEYIVSLKVVYQNRKTDRLITLLETPGITEKLQKIEFRSSELLVNMKVWVKKNKLTGFEIKTLFGRIIKIGYGEKEDEIIIDELKDKKCFILGFGVEANSTRVTGIYCYYIDTKLYDKYCYYLDILKIRVKLMLDNKYKNEIHAKKSEYDDRLKLLIDVCELPNLPFFIILSYILD